MKIQKEKSSGEILTDEKAEITKEENGSEEIIKEENDREKIDKDLDFEEFKKIIEDQEKKVYEKINPILESYNRNEITKKELIEKLADAFYSLEKEDKEE